MYDDICGMYAEVYGQIVRMVPVDTVVPIVADIPPLSLEEGDHRLRTAMADRDWLTAMALAKNLTPMPGWRQRLETQGTSPESVWPLVGLAAAVRSDLWGEDDDALDAAIAAAPTPEAQLPLVKEGMRRDFVRGFAHCLFQGVLAVTQDGEPSDHPADLLLAVLVINAYLDAKDVREFVAYIADTLLCTLEPEHLKPQAGDTEA
jgi:hypothetical protein